MKLKNNIMMLYRYCMALGEYIYQKAGVLSSFLVKTAMNGLK